MRRFLLRSFFPFWIFAGFLLFPLAAQSETGLAPTEPSAGQAPESSASRGVVSTDGEPDSRGVLPGDTLEETEGRGLVIRSNPQGARVFIDGIERGRTPFHLENIRAGRYFVQVQKEGFTERRFRVSVRSGSLTEVSVELEEAVGRLLLKVQGAPGRDSLPINPRISVDGQAFFPAESGQPAVELPVGFRTILVRAFGWEDFTTTVYVAENSFRELEVNLKPASLRLYAAVLSRRRFNPANAGSLGTTALNFEVSAPGKGTFTVLDQRGGVMLTRALRPFETWSQTILWDGRNTEGELLSDGVYTLAVKAFPLPLDDSPPAEENLSLEVVLDSTRVIYPLTLSSGKSGLLFAPLPSLLPTGSFQIEANLLAGNPPESGGAWKSLPFSTAFRFSPLEQLEVSAALNMIPFFGKDVKMGISGGAKWVFLNSASEPLGAGAGLAFSWTGKTGLTPFGAASGIEFYVPLDVDLGSPFSFTFTPAVLWTGDEGFPWEPVPRLLVSGGFMMTLTYVSAGISMRSEYDFSGDPWPPSLMAGAEIKFFPPPSSFVFSFMGGVWKRDGGFGGFGGLGIGMIY